jgi:hypothetical protein
MGLDADCSLNSDDLLSMAIEEKSPMVAKRHGHGHMTAMALTHVITDATHGARAGAGGDREELDAIRQRMQDLEQKHREAQDASALAVLD